MGAIIVIIILFAIFSIFGNGCQLRWSTNVDVDYWPKFSDIKFLLDVSMFNSEVILAILVFLVMVAIQDGQHDCWSKMATKAPLYPN